MATILQTRRTHVHPRADPFFFTQGEPEAPPGYLRRAGALVLALMLVVVAAGVLAPTLVPAGMAAGAVADAYNRVALPDAQPERLTSYLYDREGNLLTSLHGEVDRTPISISEVPRHLRLAVLAIEDAGFYEHGGVSPTSILRAAWTNLQEGYVQQGGSTITQQLIKNAYTGQGAPTVLQKLEEGILAMKLERQLTKDEILERYLNTVYFGHGAYGIYAAAKTYFNKEPRELKLIESATLAGLITAPVIYDPINNPESTEFRRDYVLTRMAEEGYITMDRARKLGAQPVQTDDGTREWAPAAYFVTTAKKFLQRKFGIDATFEGGLRVTTTLDMDMQRAAEEAVARWLPGTAGDPSAAMVVMDPQTGAIRAMVGDARHLGRSKLGLFNMATQARRQTGSAFKTFTLAAAMEDRISLDSTWHGPSQVEIEDERCQTRNPATLEDENWEPTNAGDSGVGTMTLRSATASSVNTIYAQLVLQVNPADVAEIARRMGVRSPLDAVCSITLGAEDVTVLDMTTGYATLAARGVLPRPKTVSRVEDVHGNVLFRADNRGQRALNENDADLVTHALQGVIQGGTGYRADIGRPAAGKTGSGHENTNAYFCGYIVQLVACVWVGYPQGNVPMYNIAGFPAVYGGTIPASIWHDFMAAVTQGMPVMEFAAPSFEGYDVMADPEIAIAPPPPPAPAPDPDRGDDDDEDRDRDRGGGGDGDRGGGRERD